MRLQFISLEERIVLDASALLPVIDAISTHALDSSPSHDANSPDTSHTEPLAVTDSHDAPHASDAALISAPEINVLLVASEVANAQVLANAALSNVITIYYDSINTTLAELSAKIADALHGQKADTIAIASHGTNGEFHLTGTDFVTATALSTSPALDTFWTNLSSMMKSTGRVDILGCDTALNGESMLTELQGLLDQGNSHIAVAASTDITSNETNWTLEYGNVDAGRQYFNQDALAKWNGDLFAQPTPDSFTMNKNNIVGGNVLTNDIAIEVIGGIPYNYGSAPLTVFQNTQPAFGTVTYGVAPGVAAGGSFYYTPNPNFVGTDSFIYLVQDTIDGSISQSSVTITVRNQAPLLNTSTVTLPSFQLTPHPVVAGQVGTLISSLVSSSNVTDPGGGTPLYTGLAITRLDPSFELYYSLNDGTTWSSAISSSTISTTNALLLPSQGNARILTVPLVSLSLGVGTYNAITYNDWDQTSGTIGGYANVTTRGGSTAFSVNADIARVSVTNTAPILDTTVTESLGSLPVNIAIPSNGSVVGTLVSSLASLSNVTDADPGAYTGIAITSVDSQGTLYYSINNGTTWNTAPANISETNALLLAADTNSRVLFIPNEGSELGLHSSTLTIQAWDQTSGTNGGFANATYGASSTASFSQASDTVSSTFGPVDTGPPTITVSGSTTTSELVFMSFTVIGTDPGGLPVKLSASNLPSGSYFDPATGIFSWTPTLTQGDPGADYSNLTFTGIVAELASNNTASITVPLTVFEYAGVPFGGISGPTSVGEGEQINFVVHGIVLEDPTQLLTFSVDGLPGAIVSVVPTDPSYAIISWTPGYSDAGDRGGNVTISGNAGNSITLGFGFTVTDYAGSPVVSLGASSPITTHAGETVTISPTATFPDTYQTQVWTVTGLPQGASYINNQFSWTPTYLQNGTYNITFTDTGEHNNSGSASVLIDVVNQAPILTNTVATSISVLANAADPVGAVGTLVSSLVNTPGLISDPDIGVPKGIAIAGTQANEKLFYSLNNGSTWQIASDLTAANALLLAADANTRIFLEPIGLSAGTYSSELTFFAWDQTSGTAGTLANAGPGSGTTAFSIASESTSLIVLPANNAPVFNQVSPMSVPEGQNLTFSINAADVDPGNVLTYSANSLPPGATLSPGGVFSWTPIVGQGQVAPYLITYQVDDGAHATNSVVTTIGQITVLDVNQAPSFAAGPNQTVLENAAGPQSVINWATLISAGPIDEINQQINFFVTNDNPSLFLDPPAVDSTGKLTYTLAQNHYGTAHVSVQIHDNGGSTNGGIDTSAVQTFTIQVNPIPPIAVNDSLSVFENNSLFITPEILFANDNNINSLTLSMVNVTQPGHGSLLLNVDGAYTYTPFAGYYGPDSFTYQAQDSTGTSNSATVQITVNPLLPVAIQETYHVTENQTLSVVGLGVLANDTNTNGALSAIFLSAPLNGSFVPGPGGGFTYIPQAGFYGIETFTYQGVDASGSGNIVTDTIIIDPLLPVANPINYSVAENAQLTVPAGLGILTAASDPNNLPLTLGVATPPSHGELTLNPDGSFIYTPTIGYYGSDSFVYSASDINGSALATVNITVAPLPPIAGNDSFNLSQNGTIILTPSLLLSNDSDPNGLTLDVSNGTPLSHGAITPNGDGTYTYTPTSGYYGIDTFDYKAINTLGLTSNSATVTFHILPILPSAIAETYHVAENGSLTIAGPGVLANDTNTNGVLSAVLISTTSQGSLSLSADGGFTYTPIVGVYGSDTFTYQATDSSGLSSIVTDTIVIDPLLPVAANDALSVTENQSLQIFPNTLLENDSDPNSLEMGITIITGPLHGTLVVNMIDGSYTYTPNANYYGPDSFSYQAQDENGASNTATVELTVNPVLPVGNQETYHVTENQTLTVLGLGVLTNDSNTNGGLSAIFLSGPLNGLFTSNSSGGFTYTPSIGFYGIETFTYQASDASGLSSIVTDTIIIDPLLPVTANDTLTATENQSLRILPSTLLANDSDPHPLPMRIANITQPLHGSLVKNMVDGSYTYTPNANFYGLDSFAYQAQDSNGNGNVATVSITVVPVVPVAVNDSYTVAENGTLTTTLMTGVLANDIEVNGLTLTVSDPILSTQHGSLTLNADGTFVYAPIAGYYGPDSFTYQAVDSIGSSNTATVDITVAYVAPIAINDSASTNQNTAVNINVLANDTDPSGFSLTSILLQDPTHGSVVVNPDNTFTYTPNPNYFGADSFTYTAQDGVGTSAPATVTIAIGYLPPDAVNDSAVTNENTAVNINVLANDTDPSGLSLTPILFQGPVNGSLVLNADNSFTYTPNLHYFGSDSFTYQAQDSNGVGNIATVSIEVTYVAPTANNDSAATIQNTAVNINVLANDTDPSGQSLTPVLVSGPLNGSLVLNNDGTFTYTPQVHFFGSDSFTYEAKDSNGTSSAATVSIDIAYVPPTANNDSAATNENTAVNINVLANDTDPSGQSLTPVLVSGPLNGSLILNNDGTFTYTPQAHFFGSDSFTYEAKDSNGTSSVATVSIDIAYVPPTANNDSAATNQNTAVNINVLANDTDPSALGLTPTLVQGPAHGTLVLNGDNTFTYTPDLHYFGPDSFTYQAQDSHEVGNIATVSINVSYVAPTAINDSAVTNENTPVNINVLSNDTDPSGETLIPILIQGPSNGSVVFSNGSYVYTPALNFFGQDSFTYRVQDNSDVSNIATVNIDVAPVNQAPSFNKGLNQTIDENSGAQIVAGWATNLSKGPANESSQTLSFQVSNDNPLLFSVGPSIDANGNLTYTSGLNAYGSATVTVQIHDDGGTANGGADTSLAQTFLITVNSEAPIAVNDSSSTLENTPTIIHVLANDSDVNTLPLTPVLGIGPTHGSLSLNLDGSFTYTPDLHYFGSDSFSYQAKDSNGLLSNTATVIISVVYVAPTANNDSFTGYENTPFNIDILANDTDPTGLTLDPNLVQAPAHGLLDLHNGILTYTPNLGFFGTDSFIYNAQDLYGTSNNATVSIIVAPVNQAPSFTEGGNQTVDENAGAQMVTGWATALIAGPINESSQTLSFVVSTDNPGLFSAGPAVDSSGNLTYTPALNAFGSATVTVRIQDSGGTANGGVDTSAPQTFTITVNSAAPVAVNDSFSVNENGSLTPLVPGVLGNDTDINALALTAVLKTGPTHGTLNFNSDGTFTYTPTSQYFGPDSFTYEAKDSNGILSNTATVNIQIAYLPPVALNDSASTTENSSVNINVLANDTDPSGLALTPVVVQGPTHGSVALSNGSFIYTPTLNTFGSDSFTYQAQDSNGTSSAATVSITIAPVNQAPSFVEGGNQTVTENAGAQTVAGWATALSAGPANESSQMLSFIVSSNNSSLFSAGPSIDASGKLSYTPALNAFGNATVTVQIHDDGGVLNGGTDTSLAQTFTITVNSLPPVANPDSYSVIENGIIPASGLNNVLANDSDVNNLPLTAVLVSGPIHGTLTLSSGGIINYVPDLNFVGADSFTYKAQDSNGLFSNVTTANIAVGYLPPIANNDSATTNENVPVNINVLANDSDPVSLPLTASLVQGPTKGTLVLNGDNTFTYTPNSNTFGSDSFTYEAKDANGVGNIATVTITVNPVNQIPSFTKGANQIVAENSGPQTVTGWATNLSAGPLNESGQTLSFIVTSDNPGLFGQSPAVDASGNLTFTAGINAFGTAIVSVQIHDNGGTANGGLDTSLIQTFTITVKSLAPVANADAYSVNENSVLVGSAVNSVLINDSDINNLPLSAILGTGPSHGSITLNSNGSFTYTPVANYFGSDSFTYQAKDSNGLLSSTATVTITVDPVNQAPSFTKGLSQTVAANSGAHTVTGWATNLSSGPANESLQTLSFVVTNNNPSFFLVAPDVDSNGTLTYTPAITAAGIVTVSVEIKDSGGTANGGVDTSAPQLFDIIITAAPPPASAPIANPDTYSVNENGVLSVGAVNSVLLNDTAEAGNTLTAVLKAGPSHGDLILNSNGTFTYTPTANYFGSDSFTYQAKDSSGALSADTTVSLTINELAVNQAPSFTKGINQKVVENSGTRTVTGWATNLSAGSLSESAQTLNFIVTSDNPSLFAAGPSIDANGNLTFTPVANTFGIATVTVQIHDNGGTANGGIDTSLAQTFTITVTGTPPVALADSYTLSENGVLTVSAANGILINDTDPNSLPLTASRGIGPTHGTLTLNTDGSFVYTPTANYIGTDSFTYQARNSSTAFSTPATVSLSIIAPPPPPLPPVANPDSYTVNANSVLVVNAANGILANDTDPNSLPLSAVLGTGPLHGVLGITALGGFNYTPFANYTGSDSFTYQAKDSSGAISTPTTVSLTVNPLVVNQAPAFTKGQNQTVVENTGVHTVTNWATNISAGPGSESAQIVNFIVTNDNPRMFSSAPTVSANGTLSYVLAPNWSGTANVTVRAHDNGGTANGGIDTSAPQTFKIIETFVNLAPVAVNDAISGNRGQLIQGNVLTNDSDLHNGAPGENNGPLHVNLISNASRGSLVLNSNGTFSYTSQSGATSDQFTYQAIDSLGGVSNTATVSISLLASQQDLSLTLSSGTRSYTEDQSTFLTLDPFAKLADLSSPRFGAGRLTVEFINGTGSSADNLWILNGYGATSIRNNVYSGSKLVGTIVASGSNGSSLVINFNSNALVTDVQNVIRSIGYSNNNHFNPSTVTRNIQFTVTDADRSTTIKSLNVNFIARNDAPIINTPAPIVVARNTPVSIQGLSVLDDGGANAIERVTISASHGTLSLNSSLLSNMTSVQFLVGDGTLDRTISFTASLREINLILGNLTYRPDANFTGNDKLSVLVNDQGAGGVGGALSTTRFLNINVGSPFRFPGFFPFGGRDR